MKDADRDWISNNEATQPTQPHTGLEPRLPDGFGFEKEPHVELQIPGMALYTYRYRRYLTPWQDPTIGLFLGEPNCEVWKSPIKSRTWSKTLYGRGFGSDVWINWENSPKTTDFNSKTLFLTGFDFQLGRVHECFKKWTLAQLTHTKGAFLFHLRLESHIHGPLRMDACDRM